MTQSRKLDLADPDTLYLKVELFDTDQTDVPRIMVTLKSEIVGYFYRQDDGALAFFNTMNIPVHPQ